MITVTSCYSEPCACLSRTSLEDLLPPPSVNSRFCASGGTYLGERGNVVMMKLLLFIFCGDSRILGGGNPLELTLVTTSNTDV